MSVMHGPDGTLRASINPFLPANEYVPDGEPHVFGERVYVHGSHDLADVSPGLCAGDYVCYSAALSDLSQWRYEGVIYRRDQDPFARKMAQRGDRLGMRSHLLAPDVVQVDQKYYLYYGVGVSESGLAVAVADSPTGPFEYLGRVRYPESEKPVDWRDDKDGIDDGDMACATCAPLSRTRPAATPPRSSAQSPPRLLRDVLFGSHHDAHFVNGPSIREIDDRFVLSYYATGSGRFNGMYHAIADAPTGPFTPVGPLVSLGNSRLHGQRTPTDHVGNIHGGMFCVGDQWYQIYHRQTKAGRSACAAPLTRTAAGRLRARGTHLDGVQCASPRRVQPVAGLHGQPPDQPQG